MGGLYLGICPGAYSSSDPQTSFRSAVWVDEIPFRLLEESLRKRSPEYARPYSHYGPTPVIHQEWLQILGDWVQLRSLILKARTPQQMIRLRFPEKRRVLMDFKRSFAKTRAKLLALLDELMKWVRATLANCEILTVLGI